MSQARSIARGRRNPRLGAGILVCLACGCAVQAANGPAPPPADDSAGSGGSVSSAAGTGTAGSSEPTSAGSPATTGGSSGGTAPSQSSGGTAASPAGSGGTASGGSLGAAGSIGSGSAGSPTTSSGDKCKSTGPNGEAFYDDFEDGEFAVCPEWLDADPTLGGMWSVKDDGGTKVLSQGASVSDWIIAVSGDYKVTDQTVQAKVKYTSKPGSIGIFARFQDARNFYYLYLDGSNVVLRGKVNNSSLTSVKAKMPTVEGTWYTLKLSVKGSTLSGYLNDTMLVTTTNASIPSGGVGVGTSDASGEFDNVTVTVP